ncbi:MAG: hypothetical protein DRI79_12125 [Chloroflexi bacterium]|nr:MAG: hypothetical protein DRI79_12125 [Chloroflexota bacterium]
MNKKAGEIMGESVIAGVMLEAAELTKSAMADGLLGRAAGEILTGAALEPASVPGDHEGIHYVAVGPTKVGFFSVKRGFFKNSLDELLVQHSRSDVQAVEIESGVMPTAHFVLRDGTHYVLKCARINLGKLKEVRELLTTQ